MNHKEMVEMLRKAVEMTNNDPNIYVDYSYYGATDILIVNILHGMCYAKCCMHPKEGSIDSNTEQLFKNIEDGKPLMNGLRYIHYRGI